MYSGLLIYYALWNEGCCEAEVYLNENQMCSILMEYLTSCRHFL